MKFKISENIKRIDLHDSSIDLLEINSDKIILIFDWAKLENYKQKNPDGIILGKCRLELYGIIETRFEITNDEETKTIKFLEDFQSRLDIIGENYSENDNHIRIGSIINYEGKLAWANWNLSFNIFDFYWNNHVTFEEWKNGAITE